MPPAPDPRGVVAHLHLPWWSLRVTLAYLRRQMAKPKCSFCGKTQDDVGLIGGPKEVFICDECVQMCADIFWPDLDFPWSVSSRQDR